MSEQLQTYSVRAVSDSFPLRAVVQTDKHQFLVDSSRGPGEEIDPIRTFFGAVAACAVTLTEEIAQDLGVPLTAIQADIQATRSTASPQTFQSVHLDATLAGPDEAQARDLIDRFSKR